MSELERKILSLPELRISIRHLRWRGRFISQVFLWVGHYPVGYGKFHGTYSNKRVLDELQYRPGRFRRHGGWNYAQELGLV